MSDTWKEATDEQIHDYYAQEYPPRVQELPRHITPSGPLQFAVALRHSHPQRDGKGWTDWVRRATRDPNDFPPKGSATPTFHDGTGAPSMDAVTKFIQRTDKFDPRRHHNEPKSLKPTEQSDDLDRPVPEAVYYRLLNHQLGWVLLFDIDAKDVAYWRVMEQYPQVGGKEATLEAAGVVEQEPEGYSYTFADVQRAIEISFELREQLSGMLNAEKFINVYSGQGAHLYVLDDHVLSYTKQTREGLKDYLRESKYMQYPIDPVVTQSSDRLVRLPYSLHADVSRVCQPISSPDFDFRTEAKPDFLLDQPEVDQ